MRATCPDCGAQAHVTAFFVEDDGKRLAALLGPMAPDLGRAVIGYLGLFKPAKTALRLARAVKIVEELQQLVEPGTVCNDERSGVRRPASPATWAAGIEQMLAQRTSLTLPLANHNYLRAVVFGLADKADAAAERAVEEQRRSRTSSTGVSGTASDSPLVNQLKWINQMERLGGEYTPEWAEGERRKARGEIRQWLSSRI
ncbi:MAG: hypothetical protein NVV60_01535 [Luteimonas sp.]|nr:hypothetical protein [Luteimonas sp.]